jgi:hypothetical protein
MMPLLMMTRMWTSVGLGKVTENIKASATDYRGYELKQHKSVVLNLCETAAR